jgi:hypothetical protein
VSGDQVTLKKEMRAVISNARINGNNTAMITPLTELAVIKAGSGGKMTASSIDAANAKIALFFNLNDIISTKPIIGGTGDQEKYAIFLASLSQYVNNNKNQGEALDDAMSRLLTKISDDLEFEGGFSIATITGINTAISDYNNSGRNKTGVNLTPLTIPTSATLRLKLSSGVTTTIGALDVTVNFPAGITVEADVVTGATLTNVVEPTGDAANGGISLCKFTAATATAPAQLRITLLNTSGFSMGDFAMVAVDRDPAGSFPMHEQDFAVTSVAVTAPDGSSPSGVTAASSFIGVELK